MIASTLYSVFGIVAKHGILCLIQLFRQTLSRKSVNEQEYMTISIGIMGSKNLVLLY